MNDSRTSTRARLRPLHSLVIAALALTACGSDDGDQALSGVVREPAPVVDETTLPSLTEPGTEVSFRADPGEIKVVSFGFTNCPDVCPTTMADLTVALRKLGDERADDVDVLMVTVDPDRDLDVAADYVSSFIDGAIAAGTSDLDRLDAAGEPFGANWEVRTLDDGTIEVDHSPFLYAVDDQGELVVSWQFGASSDDMRSDLDILLDRYEA